jgi:hypothetical protein
MEPAQPGNASNDDPKRAFSMRNYLSEDLHVKKQIQTVEQPRQPRSPLRESNDSDPATVNRDKSTSSSEKRDSSAKRNSFFSKRPKSGVTTNSNESTTRSQTPLPSAFGEPSIPPSILEIPLVPAETNTSKSRFLFGRSRKHRKSSVSKLRASSPIEADDESDQYGYQKEEKHRRSSSSDRRMRISNPFGFQHVAKIEKQREERDKSDIFADFRALRKGHRTAIIGPSREVESDLPTVQDKQQKRPPPLRPKRSDELLAEDVLSPSLHGMPPLRQIRSAETFALPLPPVPVSTGPRQHAHRPPPLKQVPNIFAPDYLPRNTASDEWDRLLPLYDNRPSMNPNEVGFYPISHSEMVQEPIRSPMFNPPLEQVPEEPEGTLSNRQSVDYSRQLSMRHSKSSPLLSRRAPKFPRSSQDELPVPSGVEITVTERPISQDSQGSDTLGDLARLSVPVKELEENSLTRANSIARETGASWEDDVDYCYQHAAEADCDFDWNNISRLDDADSDDLYRDDGPFPNTKKLQKREQSCSMASTASSEGDQYKLTSRVYRVPSKEGVPELDYRSSHSASTNSISVLTPLDKFSFPSSESVRVKRESNKDALSPHIPHGTDLSMSQYYDDVSTKASSSPPAIPIRSDSRDKTLSSEIIKRFDFLPTPPPSAKQSPTIPMLSERKSAPKDLSVNTIVAQLREPTLDSPVSPDQPQSLEQPPPPPPKSPRTLMRQSTNEDVPLLRPRNYNSTLNAAKLKLIDAQDRLQGLGPTSMPRKNSDDSVVTAIPLSKPLTPPKSPYVGNMAPGGLTYFSTPSPTPSAESSYFVPPASSKSPQIKPRRDFQIQPVFQQPREIPRPQHDFLPPLDFDKSQEEDYQRPQAHRKVSSDGAAGIETPPTSPPPPRNASANGIRPARSSYSLFPVPPKTPPASGRAMLSPMRGTFPPGTPPLPTGYPMSVKSPVNAGFPAVLRSPRPKDRRLATY